MSQYPNPTKQSSSLVLNKPQHDPNQSVRPIKSQEPDLQNPKSKYISNKDEPLNKPMNKQPPYALNSDLDSLKYRIYPEETQEKELDGAYVRNSYESDPMTYPVNYQAYESRNEDLETVPERSIESEMTYKTSIVELPTNKNSFKAENDDFFPNSTRKSEQKARTFKVWEQLNTPRSIINHEDSQKIKVIENLKQENLNKEELQVKLNAMAIEHDSLKAETLQLRNERYRYLEEFSQKLGFFQNENEKLRGTVNQMEEELFYRKQEMKKGLEENRAIRLEKDGLLKKLQILQNDKDELVKMNQVLTSKNKELEMEFHLHMEESNLIQEKKLEEKLNELIIENQYKYHNKEKKLRTENEALKMQIKEKNYEIDLLSNRKPEKTVNYSLASPMNMKKMLDELLIELDIKANSLEELHSEIAEFKSYHKQVNKFAELVMDMVVNCHPNNFFPGNKPSLKQAWKWLKSVLEKYMQLKKSTIKNEESIKSAMAVEEYNDLIRIMMENLKVNKKSEILDKFYQCLNDNYLFNRMLPKIKKALKVDKLISLKDLERRLEEMG